MLSSLVSVFSSNADRASAWVLLALAAVGTAAYLVRVLVAGKAHYSRTDSQGGSPLMSKSMMEGAYWVLQPFARLLIFFHITPNMISWSSLGLGLLAGICLAFGHFGFAAFFAFFSAFADTLDGMVARLLGTGSDAGEVLDATVDRYVEFFYIGGLIYYYRDFPALLVVSLFALMGSFMVSYSTAKAEALQVEPPKGSMRRPERAFYLTLGAALSPITIPVWEANREFSIPVGHPMVAALCLVAVLSNVSAIERLAEVRRRVAERAEKKRKFAYVEGEQEAVAHRKADI